MSWRMSKKGQKWLKDYERSPARKKSRNRRQKTERERNLHAKGHKRYREKYGKKVRRQVQQLKIKLGCSRCGFNKHFAALEFHHKIRSQKSFGISTAVSKCMNFEKIQKEMEKCVVLCSNCHRILTYKEKQHVSK